MLSKQDTAVLISAILLSWGVTPKSLAFSNKVNVNSVLKEQLTTLDPNSLNENSFFFDSEKSNIAILAQNTSSGNSDTVNTTEQNEPFKLWWLTPLIILVPVLGFLIYRSGSKSAQANQEKAIADESTSRVAVSSSEPSKATSELAVNPAVIDKPVQTSTTVTKIDNLDTEAVPNSEVPDRVQELTQSTQEQAESEVNHTSDNEQLLEQPQSLDISSTTEEITSESIAPLSANLESTLVENENSDNSLLEESTTPETITPSESNLPVETEKIKVQEVSEQTETEPITDRDLANISEWLNEKIDSNDKDVSVMDDFWDNLSSITEEINSEQIMDTEPITDRELANISEWLNEKVNTTILQDEDLEESSNTASETSQDLVDNSLNQEEEAEPNIKNKEGISDSTSNFLEDFLNENSNQEHKQ